MYGISTQKTQKDRRYFKLAEKVSQLVITLFLLLSFFQPASSAQVDQTVRVGALKFGTVNWELSIIKSHKLDQKEGINLEVVPLASKNASSVALLGGATDIIVSDWIWVSRLRAEGHPYTLVPYSMLAGKLMVPEKSGIKNITDLKGQSVGIAGGPLDKNWLLLRAHTLKTKGIDLADLIEPKFVAPPLLNKLFMRGELSAGLTFWHFAAKLEAAGSKSFVSIPDILPELGVEHPVPLLGWVFSEETVKTKQQQILAFLRASYAAKKILAESDDAWESIRAQMKAKNDKEFVALREEYRKGIPHTFGPDELKAAQQVFSILAHVGGESLTGPSKKLNSGTFWTGFKIQ